jgi:hypothetical protein
MENTKSLVDGLVESQLEIIRSSKDLYIESLKTALHRYRKSGIFRRFFVWLNEGTGATDWSDVGNHVVEALMANERLRAHLRDSCAEALRGNAERLAAKVLADPQFLELIRRHMA